MEQRRASQSFKRKELVAKLNATGVRAFKAAADTAKLPISSSSWCCPSAPMCR